MLSQNCQHQERQQENDKRDALEEAIIADARDEAARTSFEIEQSQQ